MLAGYAVMHTDCDVIWLANPTPYLMCLPGSSVSSVDARFDCAPLLEADIAVSSDNMSPGRDTQARAGYSAGGTFNTGLLFIRPTKDGRRFAREWHRLVVRPDAGSRFASLTSDQQVLILSRPVSTCPHRALSQHASTLSNQESTVI